MASTQACGRCGGSGTIGRFRHVAEGLCFACMGTGIERQRFIETAEEEPDIFEVEDNEFEGHREWCSLRAGCLECDCSELHPQYAETAEYWDRQQMVAS